MTSETIFPHADHDHGKCASAAISHAEAVCMKKGQRLTPLRRQVLEVLLARHHPMGAYDIIEDVAKHDKRPAPMTIYRSLDFLMEAGLVHRIESRNAYLACVQDHGADKMTAFFICDTCGMAGEANLPGVSQKLAQAAKEAGFTPKASVIEISGTCAECSRKG
jgi:Fur family zinc uptake transcriptional regulator